MPRIKFLKNNQHKFIVGVKGYLGISWSDLAQMLGISSRTLFDWRREKNLIDENAFRKCLTLTNDKVEMPVYETLPDFWNIFKAAKKGGRATAQKYGGPGTPEGRRKGGLNSQENRKLYPELYLNCSKRRIISEPKNSKELAEFVGVMLGDGGISCKSQAVITLHKKDSKNYIGLVCGMIKSLFSIDPAVYLYKKGSRKNVANIIINSTSFVSFLISKGLKIGNKVKQQVDAPDWIKKNKEFSISCLRGLIDTDGCIYYHRHITNGKKYFNVGINFSNKSVPLLKFVHKVLEDSGFNPKIFADGVTLYRELEVCKYAKNINFRNIYHENRLQNFLKKKYNTERCQRGQMKRLGKP